MSSHVVVEGSGGKKGGRERENKRGRERKRLRNLLGDSASKDTNEIMRAPPSGKLLSTPLNQQSLTLLAPRTGFLENNFSKNQGGGGGLRMIQGYYIYCGFHVYYYSIVIYDEITIQVTVMQKQWEP